MPVTISKDRFKSSYRYDSNLSKNDTIWTSGELQAIIEEQIVFPVDFYQLLLIA